MADPPPNAPASIAGIAAHKAPNNSFWGGLNTHRPPPGPPPAPTSAAAAVPLRCPLLPPPPPTTPPASGGTEGETGGPMAAPRGPILPHPPPQTPRRVIPPPSPPPPPSHSPVPASRLRGTALLRGSDAARPPLAPPGQHHCPSRCPRLWGAALGGSPGCPPPPRTPHRALPPGGPPQPPKCPPGGRGQRWTRGVRAALGGVRLRGRVLRSPPGTPLCGVVLWPCGCVLERGGLWGSPGGPPAPWLRPVWGAAPPASGCRGCGGTRGHGDPQLQRAGGKPGGRGPK